MITLATIFVVISSLWWLWLTIILFILFWRVWLYYAQNRHLSLLNWVLLEIKLPEKEERTPKAMEQVLAALHGVAKGGSIVERYVHGFMPRFFSLEILGKDGRMHFFVRTQEAYRNLVESQFYAQYPEAEITLADDYTKEVPMQLPNKEWGLWGSTAIFTGDSPYYPIRTYPEFKDDEAIEGMIDPLASLSELISHLNSGEQIWIQLNIAPTHDPWQKKAREKVSEIIGEPAKPKEKDLTQKIGDKIYHGAQLGQSGVKASVWGMQELGKVETPGKEKSEESAVPSLMQYLSPGDKLRAEAIEKKASKLGYYVVLRFVYLAKNDNFNGGNIAGFWGALKQYAIQDLNGFRPDPSNKTTIEYLFKKQRQNFRKRRVVQKYRYRSMSDEKLILNLEEIASLFYFPGLYVQAPGLPRLQTKKSAIPVDLPV